MSLTLEQLEKHWKISEAPFFGDLRLKKEKLKVLFKFREQLVERTVARLRRHNDGRMIIISGAPGVGKSTFLTHLEHNYFQSSMKVISLVSRLGPVHDNRFADMSEDQFLFVFERIEHFLYHILEENGITPRTTKSIKDFSLDLKSNRLPFLEYTRDILMPLCVQIQEHNKNLPKYFLAVDDVDYLKPDDQKQITSILKNMADISLNPVLLYTARPEAASMATSHLSSYPHHRTGAPVHLDAIPAMDVIDSRIQDVQRGSSTDHPLADEQVRKIIEDISCSNLREALQIAQACYDEADRFCQNPPHRYTRSSLIQALYGPKSPGHNVSSYTGPNRRLLNILRSLEPNDDVPYEYVALLCFERPATVNDDLFARFKEIADGLNSKNAPGGSVPDDAIIRIIELCEAEHLLQRRDSVTYDHFSRDKPAQRVERPIRNFQFCLTSKGALLLKMTSDPLYQELCNLDSWRKQVADRVRKRTISPTYLTADAELRSGE